MFKDYTASQTPDAPRPRMDAPPTRAATETAGNRVGEAVLPDGYGDHREAEYGDEEGESYLPSDSYRLVRHGGGLRWGDNMLFYISIVK